MLSNLEYQYRFGSAMQANPGKSTGTVFLPLLCRGAVVVAGGWRAPDELGSSADDLTLGSPPPLPIPMTSLPRVVCGFRLEWANAALMFLGPATKLNPITFWWVGKTQCDALLLAASAVNPVYLFYRWKTHLDITYIYQWTLFSFTSSDKTPRPMHIIAIIFHSCWHSYFTIAFKLLSIITSVWAWQSLRRCSWEHKDIR